MIIKTHTHSDGRILVSVVDSDIIGKKFEEGQAQLDLTVDFYKGKKCTADEAGDLVRNADMVNLVGEHAVALGVQEQVIDPQNVKRIKGIPFASGVNAH
ncbi:MAG: DUF424 family protein [Nanoarchaeota archaeon]